MIIGNFQHSAENNTYNGDIVTLNFKLYEVQFVPVQRRNDKEPDYRIIAPTERGHVELGAGWKRTSENGKAFISVSLDSPLMPTPVNAALFQTEGSDVASLVWSRPKAKTKGKSVELTEAA